MKPFLPLITSLVFLVSCSTSALHTPTPVIAPLENTPATETISPRSKEVLIDTLSLDSLTAYLESLTEIQAYSGWRNSASSGEKEALNYVAQTLDSFETLKAQGLEVEWEEFKVFMATEIREVSLKVVMDGQEYDIPVSTPRGPRDDTRIAMSYDSDGRFNDLEPNPLSTNGGVLYVGRESDIAALHPGGASDKIIFLDYALVDRTLGTREDVERKASTLVQAQPLAIVMITSWAPNVEESHGSFAEDVNAFDWANDNHTPLLVARLEDFAAGPAKMEDLTRIQEATFTLDTDVVSPGTSHNLVALIPGRDSSQALILGAHIDSPDNAGAMDDGAGSAILLELARVLNQTGYQPAVDTYLVWFGSEELGLYGSQYFVTQHSEPLDRTIAMIEIDCLTRPLEPLKGQLTFTYWPYADLGDFNYPLGTYLEDMAASLGIEARAQASAWLQSDNSSFSGFDVPNVNLIYDIPEGEDLHNDGALHSPYDTMERVEEMKDVFLQMAQLALSALIDLGQEAPDLRPTQAKEDRAVFVATQTEITAMTPAALTAIAMTMEYKGLDVDIVPYGATLRSSDLADADVVIALPSADYPSAETGSLEEYDVTWRDEEIEIMRQYVEEGGFLVLTNSLHRLKHFLYAPLEENEDWSDMNALAKAFGIEFALRDITQREATTLPHNLTEHLTEIHLAQGNAVPFTPSDETLARVGQTPVLALVPYGRGEVLVVGDLGILDREPVQGHDPNQRFWLNLIDYAVNRK